MDRKELAERITRCASCELSGLPHRGPVPFSTPDQETPLAVLAEAPGVREVADGRPLCGPSGRLLDRWLTAAGIPPESVARLNVVSCYPAGPPTPEHIAACRQNFRDQLEMLNPTYLLVLGKVAFSQFHLLPLATARGHWWTEGSINCLATWHPSFALRDETGYIDREARTDVLMFATGSRLTDPQGFPVGPNTCAVCGASATRREYRDILVCDSCETPEALIEKHFGGYPEVP